MVRFKLEIGNDHLATFKNKARHLIVITDNELGITSKYKIS